MTNSRTQTLAALCIGVATSDPHELRRGQELMTERGPAADSKMQAALRREFAYYLG